MIEWKPKYWLVVHILFIASCRRQQQQNQLQFRFQSTDFRKYIFEKQWEIMIEGNEAWDTLAGRFSKVNPQKCKQVKVLNQFF